MKHVWIVALLGGCNCRGSVKCAPGQVKENGVCRDVAATLQGLRWEMPCKPTNHNPDFCDASEAKPTRTATLGGDPTRMYDVTLRFRGVVEWEPYTGGTAEGLWYIGGHPDNGLYNIYQLTTSAPAQTFYLNDGKAMLANVWPIDYQKTIRVQGGATVTLLADAQDGRLVVNTDEHGKPVIIPDVAPAPAAFDGQFIQMDVISVVPVPGATGTPSGSAAPPAPSPS